MHVPIRWQATLALAVIAAVGVTIAVIGLLPAFGQSGLPRQATVPLVARDAADPTQSPEPGPSPSPTSPGGFAIRKTGDHITEDSDSAPILHIVGEVANNGAVAAENVVIEVTFLSAAGAVLGSDFTAASLQIIGPGGDSPFEILAVEFPQFDHYAIAVTEADIPPPDGGQPVSGLEIEDVVESRDDDGHLHFSGTVQNTSGAAYESVEPIGAIYDSSGNVMRVTNTHANPFHLEPGESATFELVFLDAPEFETVRFWVNAVR